MSRRGPQRANKPNCTSAGKLVTSAPDKISTKTQPPSSRQNQSVLPFFTMNPWSTSLTTEESILLDHYVQRFSRTYPTCQGPSNPFLSSLLPYAFNHKIVLDALLALSGAQHWDSDSMIMEKTTLQLRHRALRGCQALLNQPKMKEYMESQRQRQSAEHRISASEVLPLVACCALLLLYEKLVGNGKSNWMPHLSFLATLFECLPLVKEEERSSKQSEPDEILQFLYNLFLYNDLIHSTATRSSTLSNYYLTSMLSACSPSAGDMVNRYHYPHLVAQIVAGNISVTEVDIDAWDGRLDWLPSFSSASWVRPDSTAQKESSEQAVAAQLYRYTAKILLGQSLRRNYANSSIPVQDTNSSILAEQAAYTLSKLPEGSSFENALLWPISICARELTGNQVSGRRAFMDRLRQLERRFHMRHFKRMQEVLEVEWTRADKMSPIKPLNIEEDVFLLG